MKWTPRPGEFNFHPYRVPIKFRKTSAGPYFIPYFTMTVNPTWEWNAWISRLARNSDRRFRWWQITATEGISDEIVQAVTGRVVIDDSASSIVSATPWTLKQKAVSPIFFNEL